MNIVTQQSLKALYTIGLFLFFIGSTSFAQETPSRVTPPLPGFWNSAHHGGLKALPNQTGAFWGNPSAINLKQSQYVEISAYDIGAKGGASAAWALPAGEGGLFGLAINSHPIEMFDRHEIRGALAIRPTDNLRLGMVGIGQFFRDSVFIDFSAGAQYRLTDYLRGGLEMKQITEGLSPRRDSLHFKSYGVGLVYYPFYQISRKNFLLHLDWESRYLTLDEDRYTFGASYVLGPIENLRISSALSQIDLGSTQPLTSSFGIKVKEIFFQLPLSFHYTVNQIPLSAAGRTPMRHQIGFGVEFYPAQDLTPSSAQVYLNQSLLNFSVEDKTMHRAYFILSVQDDSNQFESWYLVISKVDDGMNPTEVTKSFKGNGHPPKHIVWEGRNSSGERLEKGFYSYRLIVIDQEKNHVATSWQFLEIK